MLDEKQTKQVAAALATTRGQNDVWDAVKLSILDAAKDANDIATEPATKTKERIYWNGAERQMRDLLEWLEEMRAGTYKLGDGRTVAQVMEEEEEDDKES